MLVSLTPLIFALHRHSTPLFLIVAFILMNVKRNGGADNGGQRWGATVEGDGGERRLKATMKTALKERL
jgi:hypothetical protein